MCSDLLLNELDITWTSACMQSQGLVGRESLGGGGGPLGVCCADSAYQATGFNMRIAQYSTAHAEV